MDCTMSERGVQLTWLGVNSPTKIKRKRASSKNRLVKLKKEVDPLDTLAPFLFPEEYSEYVVKSFKGKRDDECRAFIIWNYRNDIHKIQRKLFDRLVKELSSMEYLSKEVLIENLEWVIDDPFDQFSFLACLSSYVKPNQLDGLSMSKFDCYECANEFLLEIQSSLKIRLSKLRKEIATITDSGKKSSQLKTLQATLSQGVTNLDILDKCIKTYF